MRLLVNFVPLSRGSVRTPLLLQIVVVFFFFFTLVVAVRLASPRAERREQRPRDIELWGVKVDLGSL